MVKVDRMHITPEFTDLAATGARRYNTGMQATVAVRYRVQAPADLIEEYLNMEHVDCVNNFQGIFYMYARGIDSSFPYAYVVRLSQTDSETPTPETEEGLSLMLVAALAGGAFAIAIGCAIATYCICLRTAASRVEPTNKDVTDKEVLADSNEAVTRDPEHAWQEVDLHVSPLADLEEQMKQEQQKVRDLEALMKTELMKNRDTPKGLADWTTSGVGVYKDAESPKVHFERSFTQEAANVVRDYQDSSDRVSLLREQQRNRQKKKLEERIGKAIDMSNPLYENPQPTAIMPGSVGAVFENYDQGVDRLNSSREMQRDQQKKSLKDRLSRSSIDANRPAALENLANAPEDEEEETRLVRGTCQHCEEPVLATHRRSKVKGGGYVHEWCKPMMKAVRSLSTLQSMKPALAGTDNDLEKTPPKEDYASTRMCVQCEQPVLATQRRSKTKGGGYVHEWCKPLMKAALQSIKPITPNADNGLEKTPPNEDSVSTRVCVHCEQPVLDTQRRSKTKGGGYVHEWCKPLMKAAMVR